jgi:hypothetical protein
MGKLGSETGLKRDYDAYQERPEGGEYLGSPRPGDGPIAYRDYHDRFSHTPDAQLFKKLRQDLEKYDAEIAQVQEELIGVKKQNKGIKRAIAEHVCTMAECAKNSEMFSSVYKSPGDKLEETSTNYKERKENLMNEQREALSHPEATQESLLPPELQSPWNLAVERDIRSSQRREEHLKQ